MRQGKTAPEAWKAVRAGAGPTVRTRLTERRRRTESGDVVAFGVETSREGSAIAPDQITRWFFQYWGTGALGVDVFFHSHWTGGLSQADVNYAREHGISIVAVDRDGRKYCYPG